MFIKFVVANVYKICHKRLYIDYVYMFILLQGFQFIYIYIYTQ